MNWRDEQTRQQRREYYTTRAIIIGIGVCAVLYLIFAAAMSPTHTCNQGHLETYVVPIYNGDSWTYYSGNNFVCDDTLTNPSKVPS